MLENRTIATGGREKVVSMVGSTRSLREFWDSIAELPLVPRWALRGGLCLGTVGAVVGLLVGLAAYPPTAWFAVLELGIPSLVIGALLGAGAGTAALLGRRGR